MIVCNFDNNKNLLNSTIGGVARKTTPWHAHGFTCHASPNPLSDVSGHPLPKLLLIVRYIVTYQYTIGLGRGHVKTCEYTISSYEETRLSRLSSMCYCFYIDNNNDFIAILRCLLDHVTACCLGHVTLLLNMYHLHVLSAIDLHA